jgi:hypothetical protein
MFNNIWGIVIILILIYAIYKKISNLNKPYDEEKFIIQYKNQKKLQKNINIPTLMKNIPSIASYYVGIN